MKRINWKSLPEFPNYEISNFGDVRRDNKVLVGSLSKKGYRVHTLVFNKKKKTFKTHRLVAILFLPNPGLLLEVNHIDGNKLNNMSSNLEWCSHLQNMQHAVKMGLHKVPYGETSPNAKVTKENILLIRQLYKDTEITQNELALMFNTVQTNISLIVNNRTRNYD